MGRLTPQERREIYVLGLNRDMQVQEICARYDISRELYSRIMHRGNDALAEAFATHKPGKPSREEQLGAAAPLVLRLQAELEQAAARERGLRAHIRVLEAGLVFARKLIRVFTGGQEADIRLLRMSGAEKLAVCKLAREAQEQGLSLQQFARAVGKSYVTLCEWYRRFDPERPDAENITALTDRDPVSKRPLPHTLEPWVVRVIYRIADRHPDWGGRQIAWFLRRLSWSKLHLSPTTVYAYLARRRNPQEGGPNRGTGTAFFVPEWPGPWTSAPSKQAR